MNAKTMLFETSLFVTMLFVPVANAQNDVLKATFTLPDEIHWGVAVLPAGNYSLVFSSLGKAGIVQSEDGKARMFVPTGNVVDLQKGDARLVIVSRDGVQRVISLNLPLLGCSLVYEPRSETERLSIVKTDQTLTVPVLAARK